MQMSLLAVQPEQSSNPPCDSGLCELRDSTYSFFQAEVDSYGFLEVVPRVDNAEFRKIPRAQKSGPTR